MIFTLVRTPSSSFLAWPLSLSLSKLFFLSLYLWNKRVKMITSGVGVLLWATSLLDKLPILSPSLSVFLYISPSLCILSKFLNSNLQSLYSYASRVLISDLGSLRACLGILIQWMGFCKSNKSSNSSTSTLSFSFLINSTTLFLLPLWPNFSSLSLSSSWYLF